MEELWKIKEDTFNPQKINNYETVFTQGNGYMGTRGSFEEYYPNQKAATFLHGVFDDMPVVFTQLVNFPDWTALEIVIDGETFNLTSGEILNYHRELDLKNGLLLRSLRWRSPKGKITRLTFKRFVSMADIHIACLQVRIALENHSGELICRSSLDGAADSLRYKQWDWVDQGVDKDTCWLKLSTHVTNVQIGMAQRVRLIDNSNFQQQAWDIREKPSLSITASMREGESIQLEKYIALYTSRDSKNPLCAAREKLANISNRFWIDLWRNHQSVWETLWGNSDVIIEGDGQAQLAIRFNLYHLLIAAPRYDDRVSIGAKTLSGFGYHGHIFWDTEIFMLPFFTFTQPEVAKNLLSYRYYSLPGAREKATENGYQGAQFPWESAGDGREVTPTWVIHQNDRTGLTRIWTGDIEIHISSDIAYAIWLYWQVTGDDAFMLDKGAEIILDTAKFWSSRLEWHAERRMYQITDVIGPDEYHEHVNNNAFTNYFAMWHLRKAVAVAEWLRQKYSQKAKQLFERLNLTQQTFVDWDSQADQIYIPFDQSSGLVEQFDGYFDKKNILVSDFNPRTASIQNILGNEGVNATQIIKQPDVVMLMYLLPEQFNQEIMETNYNYYTLRTDLTYGSSLGHSIQSIMDVRFGAESQAYENFMRAALMDIEDLRKNTKDGIHGASAGGLWQAVVFGFGGLHFNQDKWWVEPKLPSHWKKLSFKFVWHGELTEVNINSEELS
jgi:kojibiose phosphorylase